MKKENEEKMIDDEKTDETIPFQIDVALSDPHSHHRIDRSVSDNGGTKDFRVGVNDIKEEGQCTDIGVPGTTVLANGVLSFSSLSKFKQFFKCLISKTHLSKKY